MNGAEVPPVQRGVMRTLSWVFHLDPLVELGDGQTDGQTDGRTRHTALLGYSALSSNEIIV